MTFKISYNPDWGQYTIFWGPWEDDNNLLIKNWCNAAFGSEWENGIDDLNYIRVKTKQMVTMFLLKWA